MRVMGPCEGESVCPWWQYGYFEMIGHVWGTRAIGLHLPPSAPMASTCGVYYIANYNLLEWATVHILGVKAVNQSLLVIIRHTHTKTGK
jgi:hypothetical protein